MDFNEVNLGYSQALAMEEAERCLDCRNPRCIDGCPVRVNIPQFITHLAEGDLHKAAESLLDDNALPCVTGRVCPQELQCQGVCTMNQRPIEIGQLEWYLPQSEKLLDPDANTQVGSHTNPWAKADKPPIAVVGSGPAGMINAYLLSKEGYPVTVFEAFHELGGVLRQQNAVGRQRNFLDAGQLAQVADQLGQSQMGPVIRALRTEVKQDDRTACAAFPLFGEIHYFAHNLIRAVIRFG